MSEINRSFAGETASTISSLSLGEEPFPLVILKGENTSIISHFGAAKI